MKNADECEKVINKCIIYCGNCGIIRLHAS